MASTVVRLRRSTVVIILVAVFGLLAALGVGYSELKRLNDFNARRDYDVCLGVNRQLYRTVDRLIANATPERKTEILGVVQAGETDCNVYKINP